MATERTSRPSDPFAILAPPSEPEAGAAPNGSSPPEPDQKAGKKAKKFGSKRGIETLFRTQYPMHVDLSALADSKSNIMVSINGIIVSILIASISSKVDSNPWLVFPTISLLVGCVVSLVFAILAAMPRVNRIPITFEDVRSNRANILFFGNFTHLSKREYVEGMTDMLQDKNRLYQSMMTDIYALGGVLDRKFRLLRVSYTAFAIGLTIGVSLFIAVYLFAALNSDGSALLP